MRYKAINVRFLFKIVRNKGEESARILEDEFRHTFWLSNCTSRFGVEGGSRTAVISHTSLMVGRRRRRAWGSDESGME